MTRSIAIFGLALVHILVSGCTSMVPIDPGSAPELARVQPGDTVALVTRAGTRAELVVTAVDGTAITGDGMRYPLGELETLEVKKVDPAKTGIAVLFGLAVVLLVVVVVAAISSGIPPGMPG